MSYIEKKNDAVKCLKFADSEKLLLLIKTLSISKEIGAQQV